MQNTKQIISSYNKTELESTKIKEKQGKICNCRDKKIVPTQRPVSPKGKGILDNCRTRTLT